MSAGDSGGGGDDELTLVVVSAPGLDVGCEAARVQAVVAAAEWRGAAPIDVVALAAPGASAAAAPAGEAERVLVVARRGEALALRARGAVRVRRVRRVELLALPPLLAGRAPWISHVVDGEPPILVLDLERLSPA
jgi:hypothetical protein